MLNRNGLAGIGVNGYLLFVSLINVVGMEGEVYVCNLIYFIYR